MGDRNAAGARNLVRELEDDALLLVPERHEVALMPEAGRLFEVENDVPKSNC